MCNNAAKKVSIKCALLAKIYFKDMSFLSSRVYGKLSNITVSMSTDFTLTFTQHMYLIKHLIDKRFVYLFLAVLLVKSIRV